MKLFNKIKHTSGFKEALKLVNQHPKEEVVGILTYSKDKEDIYFVNLHNTSYNKDQSATPRLLDYCKLLVYTEPIAFVHSHPIDSPLEPSVKDLNQTHASHIPWIIFQANNDKAIYIEAYSRSYQVDNIA